MVYNKIPTHLNREEWPIWLYNQDSPIPDDADPDIYKGSDSDPDHVYSSNLKTFHGEIGLYEACLIVNNLIGEPLDPNMDSDDPDYPIYGFPTYKEIKVFGTQYGLWLLIRRLVNPDLDDADTNINVREAGFAYQYTKNITGLLGMWRFLNWVYVNAGGSGCPKMINPSTTISGGGSFSPNTLYEVGTIVPPLHGDFNPGSIAQVAECDNFPQTACGAQLNGTWYLNSRMVETDTPDNYDYTKGVLIDGKQDYEYMLGVAVETGPQRHKYDKDLETCVDCETPFHSGFIYSNVIKHNNINAAYALYRTLAEGDQDTGKAGIFDPGVYHDLATPGSNDWETDNFGLPAGNYALIKVFMPQKSPGNPSYIDIPEVYTENFGHPNDVLGVYAWDNFNTPHNWYKDNNSDYEYIGSFDHPDANGDDVPYFRYSYSEGYVAPRPIAIIYSRS